jgi:uncharacterized protein
MKLRGKRVLITGASSGIGADLARELAGAGADLVLAARRRPELETLAEELGKAGERAVVVTADLSTPAGADALAEEAVRALGGIDILVNNAGVDLVGKPWKDGLADRGEELFQVNFLAPMRLTNRLLGPMVERDDGALVFISSVAAWNPFPGAAYYSASKAALARAAETIRMDLKGTRVQVLAVYPGPIHTPMLAKALADEKARRVFGPLPKGDSPELARRIAASLTDDDEELIYPSVYRTTMWFSGIARRVMGAMAPGVRKKS